MNRLNAFIGPNNAGKSNIMDAINIVLGERWPSSPFQDEDFFMYDKSRTIKIETHFGAPLTENPAVHGFRLTDDGEVTIFRPLDDTGTECGYPRYINRRMRDEASLVYLGLDRASERALSPTSWTIYGKLLRYIESIVDDGQKQEFKNSVNEAFEKNVEGDLMPILDSIRNHIRTQTGLDLNFKFEPLDILQVLKYLRPYITEPHSNPTDIKYVGAGTQSSLSIAMARAYATFVKESLTIGIEEPELYLHPHACRHFYNLLKELIETGVQVVYTTHENCFVDIMDYEYIYRVVKNHGRTEVYNVRALAAAPSDELRLLSKCDESMNEIFFAKHVIVVEGFGDKMSCHLALESEGLDINKENISIIDVGGSGEIRYVSDLLNRFSINCYAVFDEDPGNVQTQGLIANTRAFLGGDCVFLQTPTLEGQHGVPHPQKITKEFALVFLPQWYSQNPAPQVYIDLKNKIESI